MLKELWACRSATFTAWCLPCQFNNRQALSSACKKRPSRALVPLFSSPFDVFPLFSLQALHFDGSVSLPKPMWIYVDVSASLATHFRHTCPMACPIFATFISLHKLSIACLLALTLPSYPQILFPSFRCVSVRAFTISLQKPMWIWIDVSSSSLLSLQITFTLQELIWT